MWSECPLDGEGRDGEEAVATSAVGVDEVVGDFHFSADGWIAAVGVAEGWEMAEVEPKLRFGKDDEASVDVGVIPHVAEAGKGAASVSEVDAPYSGELEGCEGVLLGLLTSEVLLVEGLQTEGAGEVGGVPVEGQSGKDGMLESAAVLEVSGCAQSAVVFGMCRQCVSAIGGERCEVEFARDFPIGSCHAAAVVVEVGEEIGVAPRVRSEMLDGGGDGRAVGKLGMVKCRTEVVVELHVLCLCGLCGCDECHQKDSLIRFHLFSWF